MATKRNKTARATRKTAAAKSPAKKASKKASKKRVAKKRATRNPPGRRAPALAPIPGHCTIREHSQRVLGAHVTGARASAILRLDKKWVNGTTLRYYFFDKASDGMNVRLQSGRVVWRTWTAPAAQMSAVRKAFREWTAVGLGVEFEEVHAREDAQVRIGFMPDDGSWSYVGRDVLSQAVDDRTMNLGWDVTTPYGIDTAIHEIGHTLGLPHEHQNPNAGIEWEEEAVYAHFGAPPNNWKRDQTYYNIIRKIHVSQVGGSSWDPDSIMHYAFERGLIKSPANFRNGLTPAPGLSRTDKDWIQSFYPPLDHNYPSLVPGHSTMLGLTAGGQRNFVIAPNETRTYSMKVFGPADVVMVLFEEEEGKLRYRSGEDDSGEDTNAQISFKLVRGHRYILRTRMYYSERPKDVSLMIW